jgi:hypothetical protein
MTGVTQLFVIIIIRIWYEIVIILGVNLFRDIDSIKNKKNKKSEKTE